MSTATTKRIFVIDDESTHRILAKEYLEEAGYVVRLAEDGARALKMAKSVRPDLVLIDLMIPSIDGFELCNALKRSEGMADVPVILVTASREPDVILKGLKAGIDDFITKPIDWAFLADRVALVLGLAEQKRRLNAEKHDLEERLKFSGGRDESSRSSGDVESALRAARQSADTELQELESRYLTMLEAQTLAAETASRLHAQELAECKANHTAILAEAECAAREEFAQERQALITKITALELEKQNAVESTLQRATAEYESTVRQLEDKLAAAHEDLVHSRYQHAKELADTRAAAEEQLARQAEQASQQVQSLVASHTAQLSDLERKLDESLTSGANAAERVRAELEDQFGEKLRSCWAITQTVTAAQVRALKLLSERIRSIQSNGASGAIAGCQAEAQLQTERMIGTISTALGNLRMLAHMMSGEAVLDESIFDASEIVEEAAAKLSSFAAMNRISLSCSLPDRPVCIRADRPRVTYGLVSLAMNAIRYSPAGTEVTIAVHGGMDRPAAIEVLDKGMGIAPAHLAALQNCLDSPSATLAADRFGFGIPLAAAIARLHDGALELESLPGRGTMAALRFPETRNLDQLHQPAPVKSAESAAR
jgi:DNA-binding response OmpR family regulator/signal transduction histidine kinase